MDEWNLIDSTHRTHGLPAAAKKPMTLRPLILKICALGIAFAVIGLAVRLADMASRASIEVPKSSNGAVYSFGSRPLVTIEMSRSGKVWINSRSFHDLSTLDEFLHKHSTFAGKSLRAVFRCDHRADGKLMMAMISELQKINPGLAAIVAVKAEGSERESHIGVALLLDMAGRESNEANAPAPTDASPLPLSPKVDTSPAGKEVDSGPEILRVAVNSDGSFTTDGNNFDKVEFRDQWRIAAATANILGEELHVYAEIGEECTVQHFVDLLDVAEAEHSDVKFNFSIGKPVAEK